MPSIRLAGSQIDTTPVVASLADIDAQLMWLTCSSSDAPPAIVDAAIAIDARVLWTQRDP